MSTFSLQKRPAFFSRNINKTLSLMDLLWPCYFNSLLFSAFVAETHRTMMHSVELKRTSVQRLKKDLEEIEKETETRLLDIDKSNTEIKVSIINCTYQSEVNS